MTPDLLAITARCHEARDAVAQMRPGCAALVEQVLTHDVTALIARIRYLERERDHHAPGGF